MKRLSQFIALVGIILSLNSCGLPMAVARTVGSAVQAVGGAAGIAATSL